MNYFVTIEDNLKIAVVDLNAQSDKVLIFIHGWPLSKEAFEYQYHHLTNAGYRCIGIDTKGFGHSDKPNDGYDYASLANNLHQVISNLNINNFSLIAHSMGGAIAVKYIANYPNNTVDKLILLGAAVPSLTIKPNFPYGLEKSQITTLVETAFNNQPQAVNNFNDLFFFQYATKSLIDWFFKLGIQSTNTASGETAITFRDEDLFEEITKITIPTLILHGIHDRVCLFALAQIMHKTIVNSTLVPFYYSGHALFYEEKEKCNQEIINFIK